MVEASKEILTGIKINAITTFEEDDKFHLLVIECGDKIQAATLLALLHDNDFKLNTGIDTNDIPVLEILFVKPGIKRRIQLVNDNLITLFDTGLIRYLTTGFDDEKKELATFDDHIIISGFHYSKLN